MTILLILAALIIVLLFIFKGMKNKLIAVDFPNEEQTEDNLLQGKISILTYNIAGLPQGISAAKMPRKVSIAEIGEKVHRFDIVNVQEDFNYNTSFYSKNEHPYRTDTKGKIPVGDGLNTLSKFPIISYKRIPWRHCSGPDCWTVKGFTYSQIQLANKVVVDVYNVHANSSDNGRAARARRENIRQLANYILEHSENRPLIVMGDFNAHYAFKKDNLHEFLVTTGLTDGWVQYYRKGVFPEVIPKFLAQHMLSLNNDTESLDKIFFRNGDKLKFNPIDYQVELDYFRNADGYALSDHLAVSMQFEWIWEE
ncbi:Metal-dependent hydrolase, endonuclease/exonuclease/phosphatase family [Sphingobacterium lactis]|uniref:Metal-dependent hydrolase, endonuclease/exonuclease/phosphatase family n=2 Tax=Sphingobacterium lactis TaxID=797291 RepID=A0A1H5WT19_9SPHI|nr:Metal-dependent hydrolase, endonuclease/exonuclease/phosphatase family [Sphingobacterium lactis]